MRKIWIFLSLFVITSLACSMSGSAAGPSPYPLEADGLPPVPASLYPGQQYRYVMDIRALAALWNKNIVEANNPEQLRTDLIVYAEKSFTQSQVYIGGPLLGVSLPARTLVFINWGLNPNAYKLYSDDPYADPSYAQLGVDLIPIIQDSFVCHGGIPAYDCVDGLYYTTRDMRFPGRSSANNWVMISAQLTPEQIDAMRRFKRFPLFNPGVPDATPTPTPDPIVYQCHYAGTVLIAKLVGANCSGEFGVGYDGRNLGLEIWMFWDSCEWALQNGTVDPRFQIGALDGMGQFFTIEIPCNRQRFPLVEDPFVTFSQNLAAFQPPGYKILYDEKPPVGARVMLLSTFGGVFLDNITYVVDGSGVSVPTLTSVRYWWATNAEELVVVETYPESQFTKMQLPTGETVAFFVENIYFAISDSWIAEQNAFSLTTYGHPRYCDTGKVAGEKYEYTSGGLIPVSYIDQDGYLRSGNLSLPKYTVLTYLSSADFDQCLNTGSVGPLHSTNTHKHCTADLVQFDGPSYIQFSGAEYPNNGDQIWINNDEGTCAPWHK